MGKELVEKCPRCKADHITMDVKALNLLQLSHGWQHTFKAFAVCRHCGTSTIFVLDEKIDHHSLDMFERTSPLEIKGTCGAMAIAGSAGVTAQQKTAESIRPERPRPAGGNPRRGRPTGQTQAHCPDNAMLPHRWAISSAPMAAATVAR
jgi:hypothetical protein